MLPSVIVKIFMISSKFHAHIVSAESTYVCNTLLLFVVGLFCDVGILMLFQYLMFVVDCISYGSTLTEVNLITYLQEENVLWFYKVRGGLE